MGEEPALVIDDDSGVAPYHQVADDLRAAIGDGRIEIGERMPTARDLARQYEVSLTTAVRAVDDLRSDGLVETRRGKGSFVRASPSMVRRGSQRYLRSNPQLPGTALVAQVEYGVADEDVAHRLRLQVGDPVSIVHYRWTTEDGRPLQFSTQWESLGLSGGTSIEEPDTTGAHTVIERYDSIGIHVDGVEEDIVGRLPTREEAELLSMPPRSTVFEVTRTHWAGDVAVETASIIIRADRTIVNFWYTVPAT